MDSDLTINDCTEDDFAPRGKVPLTLKETGIERILDRKIVSWAAKGTYGNGGTGFFGIQLEPKNEYTGEWLILAYWGSHGWILLDGERLDAHVQNRRNIPGEPIFAVTARLLGPLSFLLLPVLLIIKLLAQASRTLWDSEWRSLVGARIYEADIAENHSVIKITKSSKNSILEIPLPGPDLPQGGRWILKGNHLEAWKISRSGRIFC